jgi:hypothetical protein
VRRKFSGFWCVWENNAHPQILLEMTTRYDQGACGATLGKRNISFSFFVYNLSIFYKKWANLYIYLFIYFWHVHTRGMGDLNLWPYFMRCSLNRLNYLLGTNEQIYWICEFGYEFNDNFLLLLLLFFFLKKIWTWDV